MFKKKLSNTNDANDKQLLLDAMQQIIDGNYTPVDTSAFSDPEVIDKFYEAILSLKKSNNSFIMRINAAMEHIGDNSCAKKMLEQISLQSNDIDAMSKASDKMESSIRSISNEIEFIRDGANEAINVSTDSVANMNETILAVNESVEEIRGINNEVQIFQDKIEQIANIIDMVKKIASQSNLLALNASIEAARAGEAGRGFAVVANQVKELSNNTTESAETVVKYVTELRESIDQLVTLVNHSTTNLEACNQKVEQSVLDINNMNEHMNLINDKILSIYDSVNTQTDVTNHFVNSLSSIIDSNSMLEEECNTTINHFYRISRYVDSVRNNMARGLSDLTMQDWIRIFQIDHHVFTWRVYNHIAGFEKLLITQLNNPKGCKLGKWAVSQTDSKITGNEHFKNVVKYHDALHKHSCDCWYATEDNNREAALSHFNLALESYEKFSNSIENLKIYLRSIGYTDETSIDKFVVK